MALKQIFVLCIFIQVVIASVTPRFRPSARLLARTPTSLSNAPPAEAQGTVDNPSSADTQGHSAPAESTPVASKETEGPASPSKAPVQVTTNKLTNEVVHTNSTSDESSTSSRPGESASKPTNKGSATVVTDRVTHVVVKTNSSDSSSPREGNPSEKPVGDSTTSKLIVHQVSKSAPTDHSSNSQPAQSDLNAHNLPTSTKPTDGPETLEPKQTQAAVPKSNESQAGKLTADGPHEIPKQAPHDSDSDEPLPKTNNRPDANDSAEAFAPNVTAMLKQPPSTTDKNDGSVVQPGFQVGYLTGTWVVAGLVVWIV